MKNHILVAILTYNEENNISEVLKDVSENFNNVLVIDNNSSDGTVEKVKKFPVIFVQHRYNLGKSDSMKTALEFAKLKKYRYLAFMDGDGQHKSIDLMNVCKKIYDTDNQLVIGFRKELYNLNLKKRVGTVILQNLFRILYQKKIYDIQSGLRIFDVSIYNKIYWTSSGINHYFADAEITCNAVKNGCRIDQIPIGTYSSESYKGMNIVQGLNLIFMITFWRFFNGN
jgi:glycosyltransferase involved in cell wall biosynthesis|tara:strand:+ start:2964 stop:3644 length:681 start_codon:yes stop_codon:yes gene_type:complete